MAYGDRPGGAKPRKRKPVLTGSRGDTGRGAKPSGPPPPTRGHGPPPPNRPTLGQVPKLERAPGQAAAKRAGQRAQKAAPAPVTPYVPRIANPTRRQVLAAKHAISGAVRLHAHRTGLSAADAAQDLRTNPQTQDFARTAAHYAAVDRDQTEQMLGGALGGRTRAERARMGRQLMAYHAQRDQVHPRQPGKVITLGPASLPIGAATKLAKRTVAATTSLDTGDIGPRTAFGKVAADAASLGTFPVIAGYEAGRATVAGLKKHPYAVLGGPAGIVAAAGSTKEGQSFAREVAKSQVEQVKHPLKFAGEHPLLAGLTVAGGVNLAGRLGGAGARALSGGERGSLVRPALAMGDDPASPIVTRRASKDITRQAFQAGADARREPLLDRQGKPVTIKDAGRTVPVLRATRREQERFQKARADFTASRKQTVERKVRQDVAHEYKIRGIKGRTAQDLVSMVAEGTIATGEHFVADLTRHRDRIRSMLNQERHDPGSTFRHPDEVKDAEHRLQVIDRGLHDPKVLAQKDRIAEAGIDIGRRLNAREEEAIGLGLLSKKRARRARLIVPAIEHVPGARHFTAAELREIEGVTKKDIGSPLQAQPEELGLHYGSLRHSNGQFLANEEIHAALRAKGRDPETVAYLPHRTDVRGRRAFHTQFRPNVRGMLEKPGKRTGTLYARGATGFGQEILTEQASRLATKTSSAREYDQAIRDIGMKHPAGRPFRGKEAAELADRLEHTTGERLIPMTMFPAKLTKEMRTAVAGEQQGTARMQAVHMNLRLPKNVRPVDQVSEAAILARINKAQRAGAKNVVLVPAAWVERSLAHLQPPGQIERAFQKLNPAFRIAVLPQFRWLTGNFAEPYLIRLPVEGSGLMNIPGMAMDIRAQKSMLSEMRDHSNPRVRRAAEQWESELGAGLFVGGKQNVIKRDLREFGKAGVAADFLRNLPVMKQAIDIFLSVPHSFFWFNREIIENPALRTSFGRNVRRDLREFTGSWMSTMLHQRQAMKELAEGYADTATQHRVITDMRRTLGQYEGFSPGLRRLTQSVMPFVPWYLNALRFIYFTMPVHHTALTALATQVGLTYQKDWEQMHKDLPPGSLRMAVPNGHGGWIDLARYTPYGAVEQQAGGEASWQSFISQLAPQFQGALAALTGEDPFGKELKVPKDPRHPQGKVAGPLELLPIAANQLAGSLIPGYSTAQRLREGGGTPYATSTPFKPKTKPGSKNMSGVRRTFDPLRPTYLRPKTSTPVPVGPTGSAPPAADDFTRLRQEAAARRAQSSGSADALLELRRAAAARRGP